MEIPSIIHKSWHKFLQPLFNDNRMYKLKHQVLPLHPFYPSPDNIFRVFSMPIENIKVVILGQDPYPNGQAIGLSFAVNKNTPLPKSLYVIFKEVIKPSTSQEFTEGLEKKDRELSNWVNDGVFLLNTALTVQQRNAGSHLIYWKWFTEEVIKIISKEINPIWMLWGAKAKSFLPLISSTSINPDILEANHPASQFFSGNTITFEGCNHFNLCNEILQKRNKQTINW